MGSRPKLGILLTASPENLIVRNVVGIAGAALESGHPVEIFLMCDGLGALSRPDVRALMAKGAAITVCAHSAKEHGVGPVAGVTFGSQFDLAMSVHTCDRFLAFN